MKKETVTTEMQQLMVERAVKQLMLAGAQFKVLFAGHEFGDLEVAKTKTTRAPKRNPGVSTYVTPYLQALEKPGDVVVIPLGDYQIHGLQSAVTARGNIMLGVGTLMTHITKGRDAVEVMLVQEPTQQKLTLQSEEDDGAQG